MYRLEDFYNLIGSLICHQLPSRTLYVGSVPLPVCARDTGIYTGIFISVLFILVFRRMNSQKPPGVPATVLMCILMLPMIMDGALSYMHITGTNNTIRLMTGLFFGLPIPFFLVPVAGFSISGKNDKLVLKHAAELIPVYAAGIFLCLVLLKGFIPYFFAGLIFVLGFLFLLSRLVYTIFARMQLKGRKKLIIITFFGTLCVLTFLFFLSAFVLQPLKNVLLGA